MTKKTALIVAPQRLGKRDLPHNINNAFNVVVAEENLFGKDHTTKNIVSNTGLNFG